MKASASGNSIAVNEHVVLSMFISQCLRSGSLLPSTSHGEGDDDSYRLELSGGESIDHGVSIERVLQRRNRRLSAGLIKKHYPMIANKYQSTSSSGKIREIAHIEYIENHLRESANELIRMNKNVSSEIDLTMSILIDLLKLDYSCEDDVDDIKIGDSASQAHSFEAGNVPLGSQLSLTLTAHENEAASTSAQDLVDLDDDCAKQGGIDAVGENDQAQDSYASCDTAQQSLMYELETNSKFRQLRKSASPESPGSSVIMPPYPLKRHLSITVLRPSNSGSRQGSPVLTPRSPRLLSTASSQEEAAAYAVASLPRKPRLPPGSSPTPPVPSRPATPAPGRPAAPAPGRPAPPPPTKAPSPPPCATPSPPPPALTAAPPVSPPSTSSSSSRSSPAVSETGSIEKRFNNVIPNYRLSTMDPQMNFAYVKVFLKHLKRLIRLDEGDKIDESEGGRRTNSKSCYIRLPKDRKRFDKDALKAELALAGFMDHFMSWEDWKRLSEEHPFIKYQLRNHRGQLQKAEEPQERVETRAQELQERGESRVEDFQLHFRFHEDLQMPQSEGPSPYSSAERIPPAHSRAVPRSSLSKVYLYENCVFSDSFGLILLNDESEIITHIEKTPDLLKRLYYSIGLIKYWRRFNKPIIFREFKRYIADPIDKLLLEEQSGQSVAYSEDGVAFFDFEGDDRELEDPARGTLISWDSLKTGLLLQRPNKKKGQSSSFDSVIRKILPGFIFPGKLSLSYLNQTSSPCDQDLKRSCLKNYIHWTQHVLGMNLWKAIDSAPYDTRTKVLERYILRIIPLDQPTLNQIKQRKNISH